MTGQVKRMGHNIIEDAPVVGIAPGNHCASGSRFVGKSLLGTDGNNPSNLTGPNPPARFKKRGFEEQAVSWTKVNSGLPHYLQDGTRIGLICSQRLLRIDVRPIFSSDFCQREMTSRGR